MTTRTRSSAKANASPAGNVPAESALTQAALLGAPVAASFPWLDANAQLMGGWMEWQRACWQPWLDLQGTVAQQLGQQWGSQWGEQWSRTWLAPTLELWTVRGAEQLA
ncbi:hypothetical protein [Aquabacterium sp.]|uniref:hypothetical protein n=1 Tax=Aquabacterium sp. TaxID=1872578 RepID=UPI0035B29926